MVEESVKFEVLGISTATGGEVQNDLSVVEIKPQKEFELVADEESSEESIAQDGVGVADEGAGGAEQRSEGANANSEIPALALEEEEQEECGFCLFMKGGPCGERFSIWQNCVDAAEKSGEGIVEKCAQTTSLLKVCMEMNHEYYGPVLDAEKAMEEVASQDDNQTADTAGKPTDQDKGRRDNSEKDNPDSDGRKEVVEVVGVTSVYGEVTEVVDVVVEASG